MSCEVYKEMLHSYVNNELSELDREDVSRHLKNCNPCSKEVGEINKLKVIAKAVKLDDINMSFIKNNIMSAIRATKKKVVPQFDIRVMTSLGASLVACGILVFMLNFTSLGTILQGQTGTIIISVQGIGQKVVQPIASFGEELTELKTGLVNLNDITNRIEQRIKGGK